VFKPRKCGVSTPLFSFQLKHLYGKLPTGQGIYKQDMSYSLSLLPPLALGAGLASGGFLLALGLHRQTNDVDLSVTLDHYLLLPPSVYVRCADGGFFLPLHAACNWPKDQLGFGHFAKIGNLTKSPRFKTYHSSS